METKEQRFSRIVEEYKRTIYTVCYMFSKDEDEVNALFQEILIRLWQGFDSFEGKSDIKTWIYRVSLNFCLNYDKKQKRAGHFQALNRGELAANSDHYPFAVRHVPCIFLENKMGDAFPYYHTVHDNWKNAVFDSYEPLFRLVRDFVERYR